MSAWTKIRRGRHENAFFRVRRRLVTPKPGFPWVLYRKPDYAVVECFTTLQAAKKLANRLAPDCA